MTHPKVFRFIILIFSALLISICILAVLIDITLFENKTHRRDAAVKSHPETQIKDLAGTGKLTIDPFLLDSFISLYTPKNEKIIEAKKVINKLKLNTLNISKLNGKKISLDLKKEVPIAVIIDNFSGARIGHAGIENASIVFETLVEGGITRIMAIFSPIKIEKIGPVRSARPYFVNWAEEFNAVLVHAGGSNDALYDIKTSDKILDISENFDDFWRDNDYRKPHNLFTSSKLIKKKILEKEWFKEPEETYLKYRMQSIKTEEKGGISEIFIDFSLIPGYDVTFIYDEEKNVFNRFYGKTSHHNLAPSNIIVMFMKYYSYDNEGRLKFNFTEEGKTYYFLNGIKKEGIWQKNENEKTGFYDTNREEMEFLRGQTWIVVIDSEKRISVKEMEK